MNNVEPSNHEPVLAVKDVEDLLEDLSKELTLPEGGLLRGELLGTVGDGRRGQLRGAGRATVELRLEEPIEAKRGDLVEVAGTPELVIEAVPAGLRFVWRGAAAKNRGTAPRFKSRRALVEAQAAKLPFETPRIDAGLRDGGRVRLIAERHSKAVAELEEAGRQYRWLKHDLRYCEDMLDPTALAAALTSLLPIVEANDVVLIAGGSGELADLDVYEDERVVGALARLTARCPTVLAVGHTGDELLTNKVVTYPIDTARAAVQLILVESGVPVAAPQQSIIEPEGNDARPRASTPPSEGRPPGALLLRLLLLGAAATLGWWARGIFADPGARPEGHANTTSSAVAASTVSPTVPAAASTR
jgi:hypothetical protein